MYAGVVAVPTYLSNLSRSFLRFESTLNDSGASVVLADTKSIKKIKEFSKNSTFLKNIKLLDFDILTNCDQLVNEPNCNVNDNAIAFLQYTSGSTSEPKGVVVCHKHIMSNSESIKKAYEFCSESITVTWLPNFHDMGLIGGIVQPIYSGHLGVILSPTTFLQRPICWLKAITKFKGTHCGGPDFGYKLCVKKIKNEDIKTINLKSWVNAYNGAESVRLSTITSFYKKFKSVGFSKRSFYPTYGLAESTLLVSGGKVRDKYRAVKVDSELIKKNIVKKRLFSSKTQSIVSCGRECFNTKIVIVNTESRTKCKDYTIGEIWVKGSSVANGYWEKRDISKKIFENYLRNSNEGPFLRTGDLGFKINEDIFVVGRLKEIVIIHGQNYYPQDIESVVEFAHPALRQSCGAVFSINTEDEESLIIIYELERKFLKKSNFEEVFRDIRNSVWESFNLKVKAIVLIKTGSVLKTSSGKIQRVLIKEMYLKNRLNVISENYLGKKL